MMERQDIELGDEPVQVGRKRRAGVVVSVRLSADEAERLMQLAEERKVSLSQVAREAITTYLLHGPVHQPAASPWTGTVTGFGNLELSYVAYGATVRTGGSVQETPRPKVAPPG